MCISFFNNFNFFKGEEAVNVLHLDMSEIYLTIWIKILIQNFDKTKKWLPFPRLPPATAH